MAEGKNSGRFHFVGHHLWLDFVNTQVMENGQAADLLRGFDDLLAWCEEARPAGLGPTASWAGHPDGARVFARALEFRGRLRGMAHALAAGRPAPEAAVDFINGVLREGSGYEQLVRVEGGYERRFHMSLDEPSQLLVPVAESAAEMLSGGDPSLVRKCESASCILYFYDNTKNHARRWCSMSVCGNRAKAAAHYRRKRGQAVHR